MGAAANPQLQAPHHCLKPLPGFHESQKSPSVWEAEQGPTVLPEQSSQGKEMFFSLSVDREVNFRPWPGFHLGWGQCDWGMSSS